MRYDIKLNANDDLEYFDNDLVYDESTEQHQKLLLTCKKGDFKESPTTCIGVAGFLKDENANGLLAEIKTQFQKDGMMVKEIKIENSELLINANY